MMQIGADGAAGAPSSREGNPARDANPNKCNNDMGEVEARDREIDPPNNKTPEKGNDIFYPLFAISDKCRTAEVPNKPETNAPQKTPPGRGIKRSNLQKSPTWNWDNTELNNSIDLTWDENSQRSVKKAKRICGSQTAKNLIGNNDKTTEGINLARKFRKLLTSLDTYSKQLLKEIEENPKTKLTTKSKATEIRSVVSQMSTTSMQAMLEDLELRNVGCSRGISRSATDCATQTYTSEKEMQEAEIANDLRKVIDASNVSELPRLVQKTWPEQTFRNTKEADPKDLKKYNTAAILCTNASQEDLKVLSRAVPFQLRTAIEGKKLEAGKVICTVKRSCLETETAVTEEEESYYFAVGIENDKEEDESIRDLAEGIKRVKEIAENRNVDNICFVNGDKNQVLKLRKVIEYVYRYDSERQVYFTTLRKANGKHSQEKASTTETYAESLKTRSSHRKRGQVDTVRIELQKKGDLEALKATRRMLRENVKTKELGVQVQSVHIEGDALLIKIKARQENGSAAFCDAIKNHLQDRGNAQLKTSTRTVVLRDLDDITTEHEIEHAILHALNIKTAITVKKLNKNGNKKPIAFVSLSDSHAEVLLKMGKIEIGWVRCRIHELITPVKCYKCQRYGHKAEGCTTNSNDMKDKCLKCCTTGHTAKICNSEARCYQCSEAGHSAGTMKCPVYRKLVEGLRGTPENKQDITK